MVGVPDMDLFQLFSAGSLC